MVKAGDPSELSCALARAAQSREELERIGSANLLRAQKYFIERCTEAYERLFYRVLDRAQRPARSSRRVGCLSGLLSPVLDLEWLGRAAELAPMLGLS